MPFLFYYYAGTGDCYTFTNAQKEKYPGWFHTTTVINGQGLYAKCDDCKCITQPPCPTGMKTSSPGKCYCDESSKFSLCLIGNTFPRGGKGQPGTCARWKKDGKTVGEGTPTLFLAA